MRCRRFTGPTRILAPLLTGLLFSMLAASAGAQPATHSHPYYDVRREVTLSGTVSSVLTRPAPGMTWGSHLLLATAGGEVDASLGRFGLQGKGALSVAVGDQIEVTGVVKTLANRQVLLVRAVKAGGRVITIRSEHGIPISPQARERAAQKSGQRGESL
jgi:hypothetical protein